MNLNDELPDDLNPDDYMVSQYDEESNEQFFLDLEEEGGEEKEVEEVVEEVEEEEVEGEEVEGEVEETEEETVETIETSTPQTPEPPPAPTQEQLSEVYNAWQEELKNRYAGLITDELSLQLLSDPAKVLPELLKSVHVSAMQDAARMMQQMVPAATTSNIQAMVEAQENEEFFFSQNEDLRPLKQEFDSFLMDYRSLPKNRSREFKDISLEAGRVFRAMRGLVMEEPKKPTRKVRPAPPALGGTAASAPPTPDNPFAALAEEFMREDI